MTVISIHQPNYLPYLGFFDKMKRSDIFVIYDDAQFVKSDFHHRNRIRIYPDWKWLTVPVEKKSIPIREIEINNNFFWKGIRWEEVHSKEICENYTDALFYDLYEEDLREIYKKKYHKLIDLNMEIIYFIKKSFDIDTKIVYSSDMGFTTTSTDRLVEIVEELEGDVYLSGAGGRDYLDIKKFENKGIALDFQNFKHPVYRQCYEGFIPNMSAIDALFNAGKIVY